MKNVRISKIENRLFEKSMDMINVFPISTPSIFNEKTTLVLVNDSALSEVLLLLVNVMELNRMIWNGRDFDGQ